MRSSPRGPPFLHPRPQPTPHPNVTTFCFHPYLNTGNLPKNQNVKPTTAKKRGRGRPKRERQRNGRFLGEMHCRPQEPEVKIKARSASFLSSFKTPAHTRTRAHTHAHTHACTRRTLSSLAGWRAGTGSDSQRGPCWQEQLQSKTARGPGGGRPQRQRRRKQVPTAAA